MEGTIDFSVSLSKRLSLFSPTIEHIEKLIKLLKSHITPSVIRNKNFFKNHSDHIYIISGGFVEYILPVVKDFGIKEGHILANSFIKNKQNNIIGFDKNNPLANNDGKTKAVKNLDLKGDVLAIGDGYTDYLLKKNGVVKKFFAFTENANRASVTSKADDVLFNFDELFFLYGANTENSALKTGPVAVILGQPHKTVVEQLEQEGFKVKIQEQAVLGKSLIQLTKNATVFFVDSQTPITPTLLEHADKLLAIGRFGLTTAKIDLDACTKKGVAVFNAPYTNIRSVAELALGEIIMLSRQTFVKSMQLKNSVWDKALVSSHEIKGKNLGIIGYYAAGTQLSILAELLGMHVYFYDKEERASLGNAKPCQSLEELLRISDVISVHVEGSHAVDYPLTEKEFLLMRDGVLFINLSSGYIIDEKLLASQLKSGKLGGIATDVFTKEPKNPKDHFTSVLQDLPNVILTPHIGGTTEEATAASGNFVVQKILNYLTNGTTVGSINLPQLTIPNNSHNHRFLHIHANIPGVLARINAVMLANQANIEGQYLKTNEKIGYVITDISTQNVSMIIKNLQDIPGTIRVREIF